MSQNVFPEENLVSALHTRIYVCAHCTCLFCLSLKQDGWAVPSTSLPKHSYHDAPEAILAILQRSLSVIPPGHTANAG